MRKHPRSLPLWTGQLKRSRHTCNRQETAKLQRRIYVDAGRSRRGASFVAGRNDWRHKLDFFFPRRRYFFPKVTETRLVSQSSCYSSAISPLYPNQHVMLEGDKKTSWTPVHLQLPVARWTSARTGVLFLFSNALYQISFSNASYLHTGMVSV